MAEMHEREVPVFERILSERKPENSSRAAYRTESSDC